MRKLREKMVLAALFLTAGAAAAGQTGGNPAATRKTAAFLAPERLTRGELSPEAYAFKQRVYRLHVQRGEKAGRARIYDLPPDALATIPGTNVVMRWDAAIALGRLLAAARTDLADDLKSDDPARAERHQKASQVKELAVNNAYRSASTQFAIWDRNFPKYLADTQKERAALPGGEFGDKAAGLLRDFIGVRVAAPGFSNHQGGIAVDFALRLKDDKTLSASMAQTDPWKSSWFWDWLNRRAAAFGFVPYLPEPWHWEYKPGGAGRT